MNRTALLIVMTVWGCAPATTTSPMLEELGSSHVAPVAAPRNEVTADQARIHFHMNQRLDDLREVGDLLVAGKFADAQALSFMLSRPAHEPSLPSWSEGSVRIAAAARSIANARTASEACRLLSRVTEVCADCHDRMNARIDARLLDHAECQRVTGLASRPDRREH